MTVDLRKSGDRLRDNCAAGDHVGLPWLYHCLACNVSLDVPHPDECVGCLLGTGQ